MAYLLIANASLLLSAAIWAAAEVGVRYAAKDIVASSGLSVTSVVASIWISAILATLISALFGGALIVILRRRLKDVVAGRRRLRNALRRNRLMLDAVASSNHDIRAPIQAIAGFTELLAATPLDLRQAKLVDVLSRSSAHVLRVSGDLVDLADEDHPAPGIRSGEVQIDAVLGLVADLTRALLDRKAVHVVAERTRDVPPVAMGDAVRIQQVLINLTSNAARFAERGTITIRCSRICSQHHPQIRFDVTDEGPGIPTLEQATLFRLRRWRSEALRGQHGWGLGLAISRRLAHQMGGEVGLQSSSAQGSHFWFALPLVDPPVVHSPAPVDPPSHANTSKPSSILIADDSEASLSLVTLLLSKWSDTITAARNGRHAVVAARAIPFDLILLDLQMSDMGGLDAASAIRALPPPHSDAVIYACSSNLDAETRKMCRDAGMDGCLLKPLTHADLDDLIRRAAKGRATGALAEV